MNEQELMTLECEIDRGCIAIMARYGKDYLAGMIAESSGIIDDKDRPFSERAIYDLFINIALDHLEPEES